MHTLEARDLDRPRRRRVRRVDADRLTAAHILGLERGARGGATRNRMKIRRRDSNGLAVAQRVLRRGLRDLSLGPGWP